MNMKVTLEQLLAIKRGEWVEFPIDRYSMGIIAFSKNAGYGFTVTTPFGARPVRWGWHPVLVIKKALDEFRSLCK